MNKKILFSILGATLIPMIALAGPESWVQNAMNSIKVIGGSIVVIGWIVAGILWLLSAGNPSKTGTARAAIVACVIGTVLVLIAAGACTFINTTLGIGGTC